MCPGSALRYFALAIAFGAVAVFSEDKKLICYFGSWSMNRSGNGQFDISYIDPSLCTHLIYSFIGLQSDASITILDEDLALSTGENGYQKVNDLRNVNSELKTMIAMGGWNEGSVNYSTVMANSTLRAKLVENIYNFLEEYDFDGFDLDWEYPNQRGGIEADKENLVLFLKELKEKFSGTEYILSAAVAAVETSANLSYLISDISQYLDFINLMTYDLHGSWDGVTGINSPLYSNNATDSATEKILSVNASVSYWLSQGAASEKLIVGIPLYGRTYTLQNSSDTGIGATTTGGGLAGPYTNESGIWSYQEICEKFNNETWQVVFDEQQSVPYAFKDDQWVGYDNERSIKAKIDYIKSMGLGGAMIWSIDEDDFRGTCGGEKYPLLTTIYASLFS